MGVAASMSISLLRDGRLWGLIACHHYSGPHEPPFGVRAAAEFLGSTLSLRLVARVEEDELEARIRAAAHAVARADRRPGPRPRARRRPWSPVTGAARPRPRAGRGRRPPTAWSTRVGRRAGRPARRCSRGWPSRTPRSSSATRCAHAGARARGRAAGRGRPAGAAAARRAGRRLAAARGGAERRLGRRPAQQGDRASARATTSGSARASRSRCGARRCAGSSEPWTTGQVRSAEELRGRLLEVLLERVAPADPHRRDRAAQPAAGVAAASRRLVGATRATSPPPGGRVGGDWYDALELPDGLLAVVVGDVAGHGLSAAAAMGQVAQRAAGVPPAR